VTRNGRILDEQGPPIAGSSRASGLREPPPISPTVSAAGSSFAYTGSGAGPSDASLGTDQKVAATFDGPDVTSQDTSASGFRVDDYDAVLPPPSPSLFKGMLRPDWASNA
jgi:hypothetical protein